jgi:hypothetical protein
MGMPPRLSHETVTVDRLLAGLTLPPGVAVFRGQGAANKIGVDDWELSVLQQFQFGDLRLETSECRLIVEVEMRVA